MILYPFFGSQDKRTGRFRLNTDSTVKLFAYIAAKSTVETCFVLPQQSQCEDELVLPSNVWMLRLPYLLDLNNLHRRLHWVPEHLMSLPERCTVMTSHDFLPYPLKCLRPDMRIISEGVDSEVAWTQTRDIFPLAWKSSDIVFCRSRRLQEQIDPFATTRLWPFAYNEDEVLQSDVKDVDVLFNARASATDYTNHKQFIAAMLGTSIRVRMTDQTNYLKDSNSVPSDWLTGPLSGVPYYELLSRSRVVVCLTRDNYGGRAIREAVASGACPVVPHLPEYIEVFGEDWPYYVTDDLRVTVERALERGWPDTRERVMSTLASQSFQSTWEMAKEDVLCGLR